MRFGDSIPLMPGDEPVHDHEVAATCGGCGIVQSLADAVLREQPHVSDYACHTCSAPLATLISADEDRWRVVLHAPLRTAWAF